MTGGKRGESDGVLGRGLEMRWSRFGVSFGSCVCCYLFCFVYSICFFMGVDRFGAMLDICLMVWESLWDGFGIVLGPCGNRFGISLRSPGIVLGTLLRY